MPVSLTLASSLHGPAENSTLDLNSSPPNSKGSSPTAAGLANASPKPSEQQRQLHPPGSAGDKAASRQGRRRTVPPPSFVESLERMAALHR